MDWTEERKREYLLSQHSLQPASSEEVDSLFRQLHHENTFVFQPPTNLARPPPTSQPLPIPLWQPTTLSLQLGNLAWWASRCPVPQVRVANGTYQLHQALQGTLTQ